MKFMLYLFFPLLACHREVIADGRVRVSASSPSVGLDTANTDRQRNLFIEGEMAAPVDCGCSLRMENIIQETDPAMCSAVVYYPEPIGSDYGPVAYNPVNGSTFMVGTSFGQIISHCMCDNVMVTPLSYTFTVTVEDAEAPEIVGGAGHFSFELSAENGTVSSDPVTSGQVSAEDNCDVNPTITHTAPSAYDCSHLDHPQTVSVTATDTDGNSVTKMFLAAVTDPWGYCNPPVITSPALKEFIDVYEGSLWTLQVEASLGNNIEGTELTYALTGVSDTNVLEIDPHGGLLGFVNTFAPTLPGCIFYEVQVTVTNTQGKQAVVDFGINIVQGTALPSSAPSPAPVAGCTNTEYAFRCGEEINVCGSSLAADDISLPGPPHPSFVWLDPNSPKCQSLTSNPLCNGKCLNGKGVSSYSVHPCDGSSTVMRLCRAPRRRLGEPQMQSERGTTYDAAVRRF